MGVHGKYVLPWPLHIIMGVHDKYVLPWPLHIIMGVHGNFLFIGSHYIIMGLHDNYVFPVVIVKLYINIIYKYFFGHLLLCYKYLII